MPSPAIVFSFLLATLYGSVFHWVVGGDARRLALLLLASWLGFTLGQALGEGLALWRIGTVNMMSASLGAVLALWLTWWFTRRPADSQG
jgi:hypothetical protein